MHNLYICMSIGLLWTLHDGTNKVPASENSQLISEVEIRGIYGNPDPLWKLGYRLDELNVNAIFVHSSSLSEKMIIRAREEGAAVYAEFPTLNGKNYVEQHPEAWAIDDSGKQVDPASWFMGVCPNEPGFRSSRMNELTRLLNTYDIDGVWMDYVHYHAQFEEPDPILVETCFCDHCLSKFQAYSGMRLAGKSASEKAEWIFLNAESKWREWRCQVIADWAMDIRKILKREKPGALLGIYHCPWTDAEFDSARINYLGLDYELLAPHVDVFSPMVYHGRMGRSAGWVEDNIRWFVGQINQYRRQEVKVWPIVQAYNDPRIISPEEFGKVLEGAITGGGTGVMMFTSGAVADDQEKILKMQAIYKEWND